jgi:hypothetical protein
MRDDTPWYSALWRVANTCHFIEDKTGTQFYVSVRTPLACTIRHAYTVCSLQGGVAV